MKNHFIGIVLICIVGAAVYFNALDNEFVWDDEYIVEKNPQIRSFAHLPEVFSTGLFQAYGVGKGSFYRPLQILTYMFDYKLWGLNPKGFHLTNIALHLFCSLLFYTIIISLVGDWRPALIAALLFVVHPLHTQAVTYISGRADLLSAFLMLFSLLLFIRSSYIAALITFVLSLLSREAAAAFPFFLLFYVFAFKNKLEPKQVRQMFRRSVLFFAVALIYIILRFTVLNFFEGTFLAETPLYLRLLTTAKNIFAYLGLLIYPQGLHIEREVVFVSSFWEAKVVVSCLLLLAIFAWMLWVRRKNAVLFFFAGWFFVALIPLSNIFPLNATIAEHWMYMASMGVFALLGLGWVRLFDWGKNRRWALLFKLELILLIVLMTIAYGHLTVLRNRVWRTPMSLFSDAKEHVPGNYKVRNNLGNVYLEQGKIGQAIVEYEASIRIQPLYAQAHANLGLAYEQKKSCGSCLKKAIREYREALRLVPGLCKTYNNLAKLYVETGKRNEALETYKQGVSNCPQEPSLHSLYGVTMAEEANLAEAIRQGKEALRLDQENATWHYNMAVIYEYNRDGKRYGPGFNLEGARSEYLAALRLDEDYGHACFNLAILYEFNADGQRYGPGFDLEKARQYYQRVLEINPQDRKARDNLNYLLALSLQPPN